MGSGRKDEENPEVSEDEVQAEKQKLNPSPEDGMEMKKIPIKTKDAHYPELPGQKDSIIQADHLKYLLIGFNGFIATLGLVLLSLTVWVRVDPEFWEYESNLSVAHFHTVCTMLIVSSLVVVLVGFLGCLGAVAERRWILIVFMGVFGIIFLLELAAVVLLWSAPYSKSIGRELEKQIQNQIDRSELDDSSRYFVDFLQEHLQCCGSISFRDYKDKNKQIPNSCQSGLTGSAFENGCAAKMLSYLRVKAGIIGGIALPILLLQLLALLAAGCLVKRIDVESSYFM